MPDRQVQNREWRDRKAGSVRILALLLSVVVAAPAWSNPSSGNAALRIGVPYLPPITRTVEARLYTEEGFELDLAREIGERLGRPVRLVHVASDQADAALAGGAVDLVLARGERPSLPAGARVIPTGFASGLALSMRTDTAIKSWADLAGRLVCVSEANGPARRHVEALGARIQIERAPARALMHVRTGECDAAIHDRALLERLFQQREWRKFSASLPATGPTELKAVIAPGQGPLGDELANAVTAVGSPEAWNQRQAKWAANVAFEVYLDQQAPDCH